MRVILLGALVFSLMSIPAANADVDQLLSFMPGAQNLSDGWVIGLPKTATDATARNSTERLDGAVQQFTLKNENEEPTAILVTLGVFEFRNADVSSKMFLENKAILQQIESEKLRFAEDYPSDCYGIVENKDLKNEKSTITCATNKFVIISTSEQNGNVYEDNKRVYTAATSVAFANFVIQNILNQQTLPDWIKNNAKWWAEGIVSDSEFAKMIEYLIDQGIITIPYTERVSEQNQTIPEWVKTNADWWAKGAISDDEFIQSLQYLIRNGIITV